MSGVRNIGIYVLENGKYVLKKKDDQQAAHGGLTTRSDFDDGSDSSVRQNTIQRDMVSSQLKSKVMANCEMTNSAIFAPRSDYIPKYFTSRKVNISNDLARESTHTINIESAVYHTPVKASCMPFTLLPIETLSNHTPEEE
jgi:hypothetical protein